MEPFSSERVAEVVLEPEEIQFLRDWFLAFRSDPQEWGSQLLVDLEFLARLCKALHPRCILDIGCRSGFETGVFRRFARGVVEAFDKEQHFQWPIFSEFDLTAVNAFQGDYYRWKESVAPRLLDSVYDLVFVDGEHSASSAEQIIHHLTPILTSPCVVLVHDIWWNETCLESYYREWENWVAWSEKKGMSIYSTGQFFRSYEHQVPFEGLEPWLYRHVIVPDPDHGAVMILYDKEAL